MKIPSFFVLVLFIPAIIIFQGCSCNGVKSKAKNAINKTGEVVGKGASEFFDGVAEGVTETFKCRVEFGDESLKDDLAYGKLKVSSGEGATDNIITIYFIYNNDFNKKLSVKVFDENGLEYGRASAMVEGKKGEASFVDFVFDKRTNIETNSVFSIE